MTIAYLLEYSPPSPMISPPKMEVPSILVKPVIIESMSCFYSN